MRNDASRRSNPQRFWARHRIPMVVLAMSPFVLAAARIASRQLYAPEPTDLTSEASAVPAPEAPSTLERMPLKPARSTIDDRAQRLALREYKNGRMSEALVVARSKNLSVLGDAIEEVERRYSDARDARSQRNIDEAI